MKPAASVPISFAGWNSTKPRDSFMAFAASIHDQAKQILLSRQAHADMVFFMPLSGKGHAVPWVGESYAALAKWIRQRVQTHYIYGVVQVGEAWVRFAETGPNDYTLKQVIGGEIRVSELRPEDRREALTVMAQTRDGYAHSWVDEILRVGPAGHVSLGECREYEGFEGRFGKLFG